MSNFNIKQIVFVTLVVFGLSCSTKSQAPEQLIPKDSMVNVIVDLHLADAILLNPMVQSKISDVSSNKLYETVMNKHRITRQQFNESLEYYAKDPKVLDSIYDVVIEKLNMIESLGYRDSIP